MPERRLTRKETAVQTRRQILDAAAAVFAREGFHGASVASIAEEAARTTGAIYSHFATKEELFLTLLAERSDTKVDHHQHLAEHTPREHLGSALADRFASLSATEGDWDLLATEFWLYAARDETVRVRLAERHRALRDGISSLLDQQLADHGRRSTIPTIDLATLVIAIGDGVGSLRRIDPDNIDANLFATGVLTLIDALSTDTESTMAPNTREQPSDDPHGRRPEMPDTSE